MGQWVLKNGGPLSYLEGFCVTQKNWQDFGEWRLERRKKLERQNLSDLISSSLKSTTNMTTTVRQIWTSFGEIDKRCCETKYLLYFFCCVIFCVVSNSCTNSNDKVNTNAGGLGILSSG